MQPYAEDISRHTKQLGELHKEIVSYHNSIKFQTMRHTATKI